MDDLKASHVRELSTIQNRIEQLDKEIQSIYDNLV